MVVFLPPAGVSTPTSQEALLLKQGFCFIYAGEVRIGLIIRFLAERQKVQPQEIEWKKEYDNLLPAGASCKYLDELAESDGFTTLEVYMRIKELAAAYRAL